MHEAIAIFKCIVEMVIMPPGGDILECTYLRDVSIGHHRFYLTLTLTHTLTQCPPLAKKGRCSVEAGTVQVHELSFNFPAHSRAQDLIGQRSHGPFSINGNFSSSLTRVFATNYKQELHRRRLVVNYNIVRLCNESLPCSLPCNLTPPGGSMTI